MTIRLGIIGRNFIVDWMLAAAAKVPALQPTAIYSRTMETGKEFAAKYDLPFVYDDLDAFAESKEFDAVYIASPVCCHYDHAKRMLQGSKHVLCEKPVTARAREVEELVALAQEKGLLFMEAMRPVYDDGLAIVRDNLPRIGQLRRVTVEFSQYSSRYDRVRAGEPGINAFDPSLCNAAIMDMGCYAIESIIHLFGRPDTVAAHATHLDSGFEASGIVLMGYPDFTAEAVYSKVAQQVAPTTFMGEDGSILMDMLTLTSRVWLRRRDGSEEDLGYVVKEPTNMVCELQAFARFVETGERPDKQNHDSILTMRVMDEARRQTGTHFSGDNF